MTLKIVDVSSHNVDDNGKILTGQIDQAQGVIIKATQGTGYVNPVANAQWSYASSKGKLLGLYHYAGGGDPIAEAKYFVNNIKNYIGHATLWLDWEEYQNASWNDHSWAKKWTDEVYKLTGVYPGIYVQASAINQVANLKDKSALWIAGYPTNSADWNVPRFMYSTAPWPTYTIWQFTSGGGLDRNVANLDANGWKKLQTPKGQSSSNKPVTSKPISKPAAKPSTYSIKNKTITQLAEDAIAGKMPSGDARKALLGKLYKGVQATINYKMKAISQSEMYKTLAEETKNGVYGNGDARTALLGGLYKGVQEKINGVAKVESARTHSVQNGENLTMIGHKLGVDWKQIAKMNGIKPPYTIYPGQKLKY